MNLLIQIAILLVILLLYFYSSNSGDKNNWLRALVLAIAIPLLGLLPNFMGIFGWLIALIVSLALISKMIGQSISGSFLFLIVIGILQYIIQLGVSRFV